MVQSGHSGTVFPGFPKRKLPGDAAGSPAARHRLRATLPVSLPATLPVLPCTTLPGVPALVYLPVYTLRVHTLGTHHGRCTARTAVWWWSQVPFWPYYRSRSWSFWPANIPVPRRIRASREVSQRRLLSLFGKPRKPRKPGKPESSPRSTARLKTPYSSGRAVQTGVS